jgi:glutamate-1-semialdehyde 2,1-aminomutase
MTNSCMVLPEAGFHDGLRQLSLKYGALLIMDETHTISSGLGGYTRVHSLRPDILSSANAWRAGCRPRSGA